MRQEQDEPPVVLVVEDDADVRGLAAALLEEIPLRVVEADNAEDAVAYLRQHAGQVALVFTDVRLPGRLDGVDLAQAVETLSPSTRVLVTSGHGGDRLSALPRGATYMAKPWRALDVLVQAEKAAHRRATAL
jgi:DNA-binding NtrC family response regulator